MKYAMSFENRSANKLKCSDAGFDCIAPERLRLWDECDWSVVSLPPFEYGPSSEETAAK